MTGSTPGLWHEGGTLRRQVALLHWLVRGEGKGSDPVRDAASAATRPGRWFGKCPSCGSFGTLVEESAAPAKGRRAAPKPLLRLAEVQAEDAERISTGVAELDRVLGGGLVPASLVLVGGEPGVGKSTLLLAALGHVSRTRRALLVTGEESAAQVKLRAERLGGTERVEILAETDLDAIVRDARAGAAGRVRDRLGADALLGGDRLGARVGRPGARGGGAAACASRRRRASRCSSSAT